MGNVTTENKQFSLFGLEEDVLEIDDLRKVDPSWNYAGEETKTLTHGIHSYPAMMIPQVASRLIKLFSKKGDIVLDPFCGSGSTLVEAKAKGRHSIGIDINPLATLIAKVKTTYIPTEKLNEVFFAIRKQINSRDFKNIKIEKPNFFNINYWFKDYVIDDLARLKIIISRINNGDVRRLAKISFSETVRDVSNTRGNEFKLYRYDEKDLKSFEPNVRKKFLDNFSNAIKAMGESEELSKKAEVKIITGDTSQPQSLKENSVDLLVTSPPYGDSGTTVAYGQFSRLASQWLGIYPEDTNLDSEMLGGKRSESLNNNLGSKALDRVLNEIQKKSPKRAHQVLKFYEDLDDCLFQISNYMKQGSNVCFVVGNRTVASQQIPTDQILEESVPRHNLAPKEIIIRDIPKKKMPSKNSPKNIKGVLEETMTKEYVLIMQKS